MLNLFRTEVLHHLKWLALMGLVYFSVLYYLYYLGSPFTQGRGASLWLLSTFIVGGAFGVYQMLLHKRANDWIYLLHRPLAPGRIWLALTLAGCVLLLLAIFVPAVLMLGIMQADGMFGIELRHYQLAVFGTATALMMYALGQFAVLGSNRLALLAFGLGLAVLNQPFLPSNRVFSALAMIALTMLMAWQSFRPDLGKLQRSPIALLLTEIPVALAGYLLIFTTFTVFAMQGVSDGSPFLNSAPESMRLVMRMEPEARVQWALERSGHADAGFLARQLQLGELIDVDPVLATSYPRRHQIPLLDGSVAAYDTERGVQWLFRHSEMLYEGRDMQSRERVGWLGPDGFLMEPDPGSAAPFTSVPLAIANNTIMDHHTLWQIDWDAQTIRKRFTNTGAALSDSLSISEHFTTLFDRNELHIFATSDILDADVELQPKAVVPLPSPSDRTPYDRLQVLELIDGYLVAGMVNVSKLSNLPTFAAEPAHLQVFSARHGAAAELIADQPLAPSGTPLYLYSDLMAAPALRVIADSFWGIQFRQPAALTFGTFTAAIPTNALIGMLLISLGSAALVATLLRHSRLPRSIRFTWIGLCACAGIPAVLGFLVGHYWKGRDRLMLPLPAVRRRTSEL